MARGKRIRTHYDNLQVSESATPAVIRAAYRALSQKWHPDKNPDERERAEQVTKIINKSYRVLADPEARREHDAWIYSQRSPETPDSDNSYSSHGTGNEETSPQSGSFSEPRDGVLFSAARSGTSDDIRRAAEFGGRVDAFDTYGMTALMWAALENTDSTVIDALIQIGSDVNSQDNQGRTALHLAAKNNGPSIVYTLLQWGGDPSLRNSWNQTAHDIAIDNPAINCSDGCYALHKLQTCGFGARPQKSPKNSSSYQKAFFEAVGDMVKWIIILGVLGSGFWSWFVE